MKVTGISMIALVLTLVAAGAGCGGVGVLSNSGAHRTVVTDGAEVRAYLAKSESILKAKEGSIAGRTKELDSLRGEYEVFWPGVLETQVKPAEWRAVVQKSKDKKTLYGTLYGLADKKLISLNGNQQNASSVPEYVSSAASKYYVAVDNLNSLSYFDDLLAEHTIGDGTKVNAGDPPPKTTSGLGTFGGAFIGFDCDRSTGQLELFRYNTDPQFDTSGAPTTVTATEQSFIDSARARLDEADRMVKAESASP